MNKPNHSKIGKRSKRKGKTYERRCAKILGEFTGVNFRSTPGSGGFNKQGGTVIREELFCGDLICDSPNFRYCIEAKNREEFSFTALIKSPEKAAFTRWWYQCVSDAKNVGLKPLLFFKPNRQDDFVVMTQDEWNNVYGHLDCPHYAINCYSSPITIVIEMGYGKNKTKEQFFVKLPQAVMIDWKQFISYHDPKSMFKEF